MLQLDISGGSRRVFIAGLLDWFDVAPPTFDAIAGAPLLAHGEVHVKTIAECGGEILGHRPLGIDGLEVPLSLGQSPGLSCELRQGYDLLGLATVEQQQELKVFSTWGYAFIKALAERRDASGIDDRGLTDEGRAFDNPTEPNWPPEGR